MRAGMNFDIFFCVARSSTTKFDNHKKARLYEIELSFLFFQWHDRVKALQSQVQVRAEKRSRRLSEYSFLSKSFILSSQKRRNIPKQETYERYFLLHHPVIKAPNFKPHLAHNFGKIQD